MNLKLKILAYAVSFVIVFSAFSPVAFAKTNKLHRMLQEDSRATIEELASVLAANPSWINEADDEYDCTPLMFAASLRYPVNVIEYLISAGADVNYKSKHERTPLSCAVKGVMHSLQERRIKLPDVGNLSVIESLIKHGAYLDGANEDVTELLYLTVSDNRSDLFNSLAGVIKQVNCKESTHGYTPLMLALAKGNVSLVSDLISRGADVNAQDKDGANVLMYASGHSIVGCDGFTMNNLAVESQCAIVRDLISRGVDVNCVDNEGRSTLMFAAATGNVDLVTDLISAGADVNAKDKDGVSALYFTISSALYSEEEEAKLANAELLIKHGADVNCLNFESKHEVFLLLSAVMQKRYRVAEFLISHGVDVNHESPDGHTPLEMASCNNDYRMISLLKNAGAQGCYCIVM